MSNTEITTGAEHIQWDLSDLYQGIDDPLLEKDRQRVRELTEDFSQKYRGMTAGLSAPELRDALEYYEKIHDLLGKIGSYAYLVWTTNTENTAYGNLLQETNELSSEISQKLVFFSLEWLELDDVSAQRLIDARELAGYRHYLESSRRYKPHMLDEKQEQLLSAKSVTGKQAWIRYFDETFGAARFELDGRKLTEQEALSKLHEPDRDLRKRASEAVTAGLGEMIRTTAFIFNTLLADKYTNDKLRKYPAWVSSRNLANEISDETVDALITSVTGRYNLPQKYYALKCRLLGLDQLYEYDRYAPVAQSPQTVSWQQARQMVLDAYSGFHPEMGKIASVFFEENWIDAAIRPGKRGGAYSAGTVPSVHPYVFMNYDGKIRDVQTLAHELGHGVHQYLSRGQGALQAGTPLTTAETASVFGEMLVFQDLLSRADDPSLRLSLLTGKIDDSIATVFRQVSMNRFEHAIHTARREEGELTPGRFSELWMQTQTDLYGDSVKLSENYNLWWSYIPHFIHTPGYVYAYAFGELLVLALYEQYQKQPDGFAENYLELLRAGGSEKPEKLVAKMDMDINSVDFWSNGLDTIGNLIEQAEKLADEI